MTHAYVSTACLHQLCGQLGACRQTCKFCDASCACTCHPGTDRVLPQPWVDQARDIAVQLLAAVYQVVVPDELEQRIATDPDLFWLRGEVQPDGTWH